MFPLGPRSPVTEPEAAALVVRYQDGDPEALSLLHDRLGVIIHMENFTLQVGVPCSGFKTMIALASFAACFIYLLNGSLFKKLVLFGAALIRAP